MSKTTRAAMCYNYHEVEAFLRSVATAVELAKATTVQWKQYDESTALNMMYGLMFFYEKPGAVNVDTKTVKSLYFAIESTTTKFVMKWMELCHEGGHIAGDNYISQLKSMRANATFNLQSTYQDARRINAEIANELARSIRGLAKVQLAGTVGVAVLGGVAGVMLASGAATLAFGSVTVGIGGGSTALTAVGLTNSLAMSTVKNWGQGESASAVAIDMGVAGTKVAAAEYFGYSAKQLVEAATKEIAESMSSRAAAEKAAKRYSKIIARKFVTPKRAGRAAKHLAKAEATIARSNSLKNIQKGGRVAGKAVPILFAAWDVIDAYSSYQDTMSQL